MSCYFCASMNLNEEINSNKAATNLQNGDVKMHFSTLVRLVSSTKGQSKKKIIEASHTYSNVNVIVTHAYVCI